MFARYLKKYLDISNNYTDEEILNNEDVITSIMQEASVNSDYYKIDNNLVGYTIHDHTIRIEDNVNDISLEFVIDNDVTSRDIMGTARYSDKCIIDLNDYYPNVKGNDQLTYCIDVINDVISQHACNEFIITLPYTDFHLTEDQITKLINYFKDADGISVKIENVDVNPEITYDLNSFKYRFLAAHPGAGKSYASDEYDNVFDLEDICILNHPDIANARPLKHPDRSEFEQNIYKDHFDNTEYPHGSVFLIHHPEQLSKLSPYVQDVSVLLIFISTDTNIRILSDKLRADNPDDPNVEQRIEAMISCNNSLIEYSKNTYLDTFMAHNGQYIDDALIYFNIQSQTT